jgi:hypothetical protein
LLAANYLGCKAYCREDRAIPGPFFEATPISSSPELNTKKLNNFPSFTSVTYTASTDQQFRRYGILRIGKTAEN